MLVMQRRLVHRRHFICSPHTDQLAGFCRFCAPLSDKHHEPVFEVAGNANNFKKRATSTQPSFAH